MRSDMTVEAYKEEIKKFVDLLTSRKELAYLRDLIEDVYNTETF